MEEKEKRDLHRSGKSDEPKEDKKAKSQNKHIKKGKETKVKKDK